MSASHAHNADAIKLSTTSRLLNVACESGLREIEGVASFAIHGPFEVPYEKRKGGRALVFDNFWREGSAAEYLADERGCYVFAIRAGRGQQPIYVGKATKTFKQETFNPANRHKCSNGFSDYAKGRPLMFFVVHPAQKGRVNEKQISEIEDFLI